MAAMLWHILHICLSMEGTLLPPAHPALCWCASAHIAHDPFVANPDFNLIPMHTHTARPGPLPAWRRRALLQLPGAVAGAPPLLRLRRNQLWLCLIVYNPAFVSWERLLNCGQ